MMRKKLLTAFGLFPLIGSAAMLVGCQEGPAEKAGEKVDQGVQNVKDAVNPPGPGEKAGRAIDKAVDH